MAVVIVALAIQKWDVIREFVYPPLDYAYASNNEVVLYATSWCGYCAKAREFLESNGIAYREFDIEKSREGRKQYNELGGGGVPILVINDNVIRGYNADKIISLLNKQSQILRLEKMITRIKSFVF